MQPTRTAANPRAFFRPAGLVIGGAVFGSMFLSDLFRPSNVLAQPEKIAPENTLNAAEQRKTMNATLVAINDRLGRIEAQLKTGISVKVTEMPPEKPKAPATK